MVKFCSELERGRYRKYLSRYQKLLRDIEKWYQDNYRDYAGMLRAETENLYENINRSLDERSDALEFAEDLSYNFGAKLSYFIISDTLVKLILSCYAYGPSQEFLDQYGIHVPAKDCSWLHYKCNEIQMVEILAKVLKDNNVKYYFDLQALMRDRKDRNDLVHASQQVACLSAIRCYNSIRSMLIFLDETCTDILQPFQEKFENGFDIDQFTAEPCSFDFTNHTTVLIVDSVHDVRSDYRRVVANLPWNLVIDLDGCSESGGLLSSVEHNNIRKETLNLSLVNSFKRNGQRFQMDCTIWYRCGDYQVPSYSSEVPIIPSNTWFKQDAGKDDWGDHIKTVLGPVLKRAELSERPLNIVTVTDDELLIQSLVDFCRAELSDYFLTWAGLSASPAWSITQYWFHRNKENEAQHFRRFVGPSSRFFEEFFNYSANWPVRTSLDSSFSLPGANRELVVIPENIRNKLANYFEPLYDNCETFCADEDCLKEAFDSSGAPVAWSLIDSQYAVPLKDEKKVERIVNSIRSLLGTKQEEHPQKRLFFLRHLPGIGGTTFARQLAWKLHRDHAVLVVKHYAPGEITNLVENLYDNVLGKNEIVLLADETLPRLKELCDDVCRIDRRCILIVSCRLSSSIPQTYPDAAREELKVLDNTCIRQLKEHFRCASRLEKPVLDNKSRNFEQSITGDMCSPFIIGLYFMEENFNINDYVRKALDLLPRNYADALAYIALGDRYNYKNLPESLIKGLLGLRLRDNFFDRARSANSIIFSNQDDDHVPYYSFKHYLLAQRYLELYNKRYYPNQNGDLKNMLYHLTTSLISGVAELAGRGALKESYLDFLSYILIQNKADFNYRLSALMNDISRSDSQIMLLNQMADLFQPYADSSLKKDEDEITSLDWTLLRLVSHANAHLGRIYWKEQKFASEAIDRCGLAKKYMPDKDPDIYHMEGTVQKEKLSERYVELKSQHEEENLQITVAQFQELEQELAQAERNFEDSCRYGSPEYGYPSKLQLYYQYLEFVYVVKGIGSKEDISLLSNRQQEIKLSFIRTLEEIDAFGELDQEAATIVETVKGRFEGNILFHDSSTLVQFYQNLVDKYTQDQSKIFELGMAQRGLIFARINSAKLKNGGTISFREIPNPDQLQKHIDQLLNQVCDVTDYREYSLKSVLYHYWMQLAKVTNTPLERALDIAIQWKEMEDARCGRGLDPRPYYYLRAIYFLLYKDGAKNRVYDAKRINHEIQDLLSGKRFDAKRGNPERIRDILVEGRGMGQLLDVSSCINDAERMRILAEAKNVPLVWDAKLEEVISYRSANMRVFSPSAWDGEKAFLKIGSKTSNTLSDEQVNDTIRFFAGYSVERLTAIPDSARDITAKEPFDVVTIVRDISCATYSAKSNTAAPMPTLSSQPNVVQSAADAVPIIKNGATVSAKILRKRGSGKKTSFDAEFCEGGQIFQAEIVNVSEPQKKKLQKMESTKETINARVVKYSAASRAYTLKVL